MKVRIFALFGLLALLLAGCGAEPVQTTPPTTTVHVHAYDVAETAAACETEGKRVFTCACGDSYQEAMPALGHSYEAAVTEATWDEPGFTTHTCARCGNSYRDGETDPQKYSQLPPSQSGEVMPFFDDAAFIGDSVLLRLQRYQAEYGCFGSAAFFSTVSYSVNHAVNNSLFLVWQGQEVTPEQAIEKSGAKKLFIMLGMNDVGYIGVDGTLANWEVLLARLRESSPELEIYIQSCTPIYPGGEKGRLTNANMDAYNARLRTFAEENGCHFVDIAAIMKNEDGAMKPELSADRYVHINEAACDLWAMELKKFVGE